MARKREPKWLVAARQHPGGLPKGEKPDWVSRVLARAGVLSELEVPRALESGRVTLNGRAVYAPLTLVRATDEVKLDGRVVPFRVATRVLMFHKPSNVICTARDPDGHRTVFEVLRPELPPQLAHFGWHCVGRLDIDTTGLLLFTNDERFVGHATSPRTHLAKRYVATVDGANDDAKLEQLRRGISLSDGPTRPALTRFRAPGVVEITVSEGRNHQVKRMLGAVGLPVRALHREAVGELALDVDVGKFRELSDVELRDKLKFESR